MADDNGRLFPARVYEKKGKIVWVEEIYKESAREKKKEVAV